jgi:hypothetical protein
MQAETDLAKQIVQLLQDIIIKGSEVIYEKQRKSAEGWGLAYPYIGPILIFERAADTLTITSTVDAKVIRNIEGWYLPDLSQTSEYLRQFSDWQGRLGENQEEDLYLIQKHLQPIALEIMHEVSSLYGFRLEPRTSPDLGLVFGLPQTTELFSEKAKDQDELRLDDELNAPELKALMDEFNLFLARLTRLANQPKVARVIFSLPLPSNDTAPREAGGRGSDPSIATLAEDTVQKNKNLSEEQLKPASTSPAHVPESIPSDLTAQWHELGKLRIRADFLEVQRGKHKWTLTLNQGKALEFVYKNHRANNSIHQRLVLHHIESPSARLREAFRSRKGLYAALFAKGEEKGHIRLNT